MKRKLLAIMLSLVLTFSCFSGLTGCDDKKVKKTAFAAPTGLAYDASTLTLKWTAVSGAETYSYSVTEKNGTTALLEKTDLADNEFSVSPLAAGDYTAKVRVNDNAAGDKTASEWASKDFTIAEAALPKLGTPTGLARNGMTISWNAVAGASNGYTLNVYETGNATNKKADNVQITTGTSYTMTASFEPGGYTMEVYANAVAGSFTQSEKATGAFTYTYPPLPSPTGLTRTGFNTVSWTAVTGATNGYTVVVKDGVTGAEIASKNDVAGTSYTVNFALVSAGENYFVEVQANAVAGTNDASSFSAAFEFNVPAQLNPPQGLVYDNHTNGVILAWNEYTAATEGFILEIYNDSDVLLKTYDIAASALSQIVNRTDVAPGTDCYALVYAKEIGAGDSTDWRLKSDASEPEYFAQSYPQLATPNVRFNEGTKLLAWNNVDNAVDYTVRAYKGAAGIFEKTDVTDNFLNMSSLMTFNGGFTYTFEVEANEVLTPVKYLASNAGSDEVLWRTWTFDNTGDLEFFTSGVQANTTNQAAGLALDNGRLKITRSATATGDNNNCMFQLYFDISANTTVTFDYTHDKGTFQIMGLQASGYGIEQTGILDGADNWGCVSPGGTGFKTIKFIGASKGIYFRIVGFSDNTVNAYIDNITIFDPAKNAQATLTISDPGTQNYLGSPFQLSTGSTGSGDGAVTYSLVSGNATVTPGGLVTANGAGNITVRATKAADSTYNQATATRIISIGKAAGANVAAPTEASKTSNSITLNAVSAPGNGQAVEYAVNKGSTTAPGSGWQETLTFAVDSESTYYAFARSKQNTNYNDGTASVSAAIITPAAAKLDTPLNLTANQTGANTRKLTWDAVTGATNGYDVVITRLSDSAVIYTDVVMTNSLDLSDKNLGFNKTYNFSVIAKTAGGKPASDPATISNYKWMTLMFNDADDISYFTGAVESMPNATLTATGTGGRLKITSGTLHVGFALLFGFTTNTGATITLDVDNSTGFFQVFGLWNDMSPMEESHKTVYDPGDPGYQWEYTLNNTGNSQVVQFQKSPSGQTYTEGLYIRILNFTTSGVAYIDNIYVKIP